MYFELLDDGINVVVRKYVWFMAVENAGDYTKLPNYKGDNIFCTWSCKNMHEANSILFPLIISEADISCKKDFGIVTQDGVFVGDPWLSYKRDKTGRPVISLKL